MSYFPGMQKGNLDSVEADAHGKIKKQTSRSMASR